MGISFGKGSRRAFKQMGTAITFRSRISLRVKSSDTPSVSNKTALRSLGEGHTLVRFCNR